MKLKRPRMLTLVALLCCVGCGQYVSYGDEATQAPAATTAPVITELGEFPELDRLNHYALAGLVATFSSEDERGEYVYMDYVALSEDVEASYQLDAYLASLAGLDPLELSAREDRLAYWINAYNASVIRGVLERFEGETSFSVIESPGFFSTRAFAFGGLLLSLDHIEQGVIRGDFENEAATQGLSEDELATVRQWHESLWEEGRVDARLHAVLNCGALGCPNLLSRKPFVYQGARLEEQLAAATAEWLGSAEKGAGPDGVSMLFTWYRQDFVDDAGSVEAFVEANRAGGKQGVEFSESLSYDWTLNTRQ